MQEIELKLQLMKPEEWDSLGLFVDQLGSSSPSKLIQMAATYFDTAEGDLRRSKMAYRIRRENDCLVATLKGGGDVRAGLHRRFEWDASVDSMVPDVSVFLDCGVDKSLLHDLNGKAFVEIVRTEFLRKCLKLQWKSSIVEIALDKGWIFSGDRKTPILEMELELKAGCVEDVIALGDFFAERFNLIKAEQSKFLRGVLLNEVSH